MRVIHITRLVRISSSAPATLPCSIGGQTRNLNLSIGSMRSQTLEFNGKVLKEINERGGVEDVDEIHAYPLA